jgi:hypothetical protein
LTSLASVESCNILVSNPGGTSTKDLPGLVASPLVNTLFDLVDALFAGWGAVLLILTLLGLLVLGLGDNLSFAEVVTPDSCPDHLGANRPIFAFDFDPSSFSWPCHG